MNHSIPIECLQEIFEYLQDDLKSLHSLLLVNKHFCINTLPTLYRNPFILLHEALFTTHEFRVALEINEKKIPLLLNIYLTYLTEEQKSEFERKEITKLLIFEKPLLFDYISYLKILPLPEIQSSILTLSNKNIITRNHIKFLEIELNKLFLINCKNIHTLTIDELSELPNLSNLNHNILQNFYYLNLVKISPPPPSSSSSKLEEIIPYCDKIKGLSLLRFGNKTPPIEHKFIIPKLINKPKALEKFCWEGVKDYDELSITKSLEKHINSITHIEIYTHFSKHIILFISKCKNLKTLRFAKNFLNNIPQFINEDDDDYFDKLIDITPFTSTTSTTFNNLQELFFGSKPTDFNHFEILLKNTNNSLKILSMIGFSNRTNNFINLYCNNLSYLNLKLSFDNFNNFFKLDSLPKSLSKLIFITSRYQNDYNNIDYYDNLLNSFFVHLSNIIHSNIKFIHLGMFYNFNSNNLSKFLISCKKKLNFPLELILPFGTLNNFTDEQKDIIKKFTMKKVLSEDSWILFLYFYLSGCRHCSSCNGDLLDDEDDPVEPFKEVIIIKKCCCWKNEIERHVLNLNEEAENVLMQDE